MNSQRNTSGYTGQNTRTASQGITAEARGQATLAVNCTSHQCQCPNPSPAYQQPAMLCTTLITEDGQLEPISYSGASLSELLRVAVVLNGQG